MYLWWVKGGDSMIVDLTLPQYNLHDESANAALMSEEEATHAAA